MIKHDLAPTFGQRGQARGEIGLGYGAPEPAVSGIVRGGHAAGLMLECATCKWDPSLADTRISDSTAVQLKMFVIPIKNVSEAEA